MYGCLLSPPDERDYKAKDYIARGVRPDEYMPAEISPITNQGTVASCVAHALATMKYYHEYRERMNMTEWSTDFIYHNRTPEMEQGTGMIVREALSRLKDCGTCLHSDLPTNTEYPNPAIKTMVTALSDRAYPQIISSYVRCFDNSDICDCIYQNGAAIVVIDIRASFRGFYVRTEDTQVLPLPSSTEPRSGYHCLCAIGYTSEGIVVQNSWGNLWGYNGLAILPWDYPIVEAWSVVDQKKEYDVITLKQDDTVATVNGREVILDVPAKTINGRVLVPVRFVSESLGCEVEYIADERMIIIRKERK